MSSRKRIIWKMRSVRYKDKHLRIAGVPGSKHQDSGGSERCPETPQRTSSRTRRMLAKALDRGDVRRRRRLPALASRGSIQKKKKRKEKEGSDRLFWKSDAGIKRRTPKSGTGRLARDRREVVNAGEGARGREKEESEEGETSDASFKNGSTG